jgi:hypothetical protein
MSLFASGWRAAPCAQVHCPPVRWCMRSATAASNSKTKPQSSPAGLCPHSWRRASTFWCLRRHALLLDASRLSSDQVASPARLRVASRPESRALQQRAAADTLPKTRQASGRPLTLRPEWCRFASTTGTPDARAPTSRNVAVAVGPRTCRSAIAGTIAQRALHWRNAKRMQRLLQKQYK